MKLIYIFLAVEFLVMSSVWSGVEAMPSMPQITTKKVFLVPSNEAGQELLDKRGYGDKEADVAMMNLMMVSGSKYEGMAHEHHTQVDKQPSKPTEKPADYIFVLTTNHKVPKIGTNIVTLVIKQKKDNKPAKNLKIKAQVYMKSMDMGTEEPAVLEVAPGKYEIKAVFSMIGPWAVKLILPTGEEKVFDFEAKSS